MDHWATRAIGSIVLCVLVGTVVSVVAPDGDVWAVRIIGTGIAVSLGAVAVVGAVAGVRERRVIYVLPLVALAATVVLVLASPPCPDILDGPCDENWVSDAVPLAALTFLVASVVALVVPRRRDGHGSMS